MDVSECETLNMIDLNSSEVQECSSAMLILELLFVQRTIGRCC